MQSKTGKELKWLLAALGATFAMGVQGDVQAATCTMTFDSQVGMQALPNGARHTSVMGPSAGAFPPAYKENCSSGGKQLWAEEDRGRKPWVANDFYHMYHLSYEASECIPGVRQDPCGMSPNITFINSLCDNPCVDATLQPRFLAPHLPDQYLRISLQPASPTQVCIDRITGNTVQPGAPNALCQTYAGALFAPASVRVYDNSVTMYFWYYEKMGVGTPAGVRYTLVSRFSHAQLPVGAKTFSGFSTKYHLMQVSGSTSDGHWSLDDVKVTH